MKRTFQIASLIIALVMLLPYSTDLNLIANDIKAFAQTPAVTTIATTTAPATTDTTVAPDEEVKPNFTFPDEMKAVTITPGVDFLKNPAQSVQATQAEIDKIIANVNSYTMTAIIINTNYNDKAYFSSSSEVTPEELALKMLMESAKKSNLFVYVNLNINFVLKQLADTNLEARINFLTHIAHKFSREYLSDGIILDGYYSSKSLPNYDYYMDNGSGIGFENWLLENGAYVFSLVSDAIHMTDNTIPVGICISNAWANTTSKPEGSATKDTFQALTDGYSDTVSYIKNGYADFVLLNDFGSIADPNVPFTPVATWWASQAVSANIPLYISHANDKLCTSAPGWISDDQIVKQLFELKSIAGYKGSAFNSYNSLVASPKTTAVLVNYYAGKVDQNSLMKELKMNSPNLKTYSTYEPTAKFQGTFDANFDVTFNGTPIVLNKAGNFYYEVPLAVGKNTFTLKSKATTYTYTITRNVKVLKSIEPTGNMSVEGKTAISVSAIAYKGSKVTATLNGKSISLTETDGQWEGSEANPSYAKFVGSFSTAGGLVNKEQSLGAIVITGNYQNKNESLPGGSVTISALPEGINPAQLIKVTTDNAMTYDYGNTSSVPSPTNPRLPIGTLDYYIKKVTYSGVDYYLTQSGKRIKASDATIVDGYTFGENSLSVANTYVENTDTILQLKMKTPIPFNIRYEPCNYYTGSGGSYYVNNFQATSVTLEFDYITGVSSPPSFPAGSIFSSASWSTTTYNDRPRYQLKLNLSQNGIFAGVTSSYSSDGTLTLRFNGYKRSLAGMVFVIDPGHGLGAITPGVFDPGATGQVVEEKENIAMAKILTAKLTAQGATVHMLQTDTTQINSYTRSSYARQFSPDMYIAIHCNSASADARGTEAFYFTPFSQPLANSVSSSVASYFTNNVYSDKANKNRGAKWDYYAVTLQYDFPSILVEPGFVTNMEDAMALDNPTNQAGICDAIINGVVQYLGR